MGGRLILIKHMLQSIPIYVLAALEPPKKVFTMIEKFFAEFLWGSNNGVDKRHWMSWQKLCRLISPNGLGVLSLNHLSLAFSGKLFWNFHKKNFPFGPNS